MRRKTGEAAERPIETAFRIEVVETYGRLEEIAAAWEKLAARDPGTFVFQGYPWLSTWLRHYPGAHPYLAVAWRGAELSAAIPLCAYDVGLPGARMRSLRFAADLNSDYCDALSDPRWPEDLALLWADLTRRRDWHLIDLRYVPATSRLSGAVAQHRAGVRVLRQQQDIAPYMEVGKDWRENVSRNHRTEVLRRQRRAHEQGEMTFGVAGTPEEADSMLEELAAMHVARWQGRQETSVFRFDDYRAWLRDLCHELLKRRQLYLCRLAMDGKPMSMALGFLSGRRLLRYTSTFDMAYAPFGPVHLLLVAVLDDLRARGTVEIHDFGRGGESYKARWTQQSQTVERFLVARSSALGLAAFWWSGHLKAFLWRHPRLGTAVREIRRRIALRVRAARRGG